MNITILIPVSWLNALGLDASLQTDSSEITGISKASLMHALSTSLETTALHALASPPTDDSGPTHRVIISLPSSSASVLHSLAKMSGLTPGPTGKRLIGMVARGDIHGFLLDSAEPTVRPDHPTAVLNRAMGLAPRAAQAQLYDDVWDSLTSSRIGMVEGGTGIGKTRAMVCAAVRWTKERKSSIAICAPTLVLLRQFVAEHKAQHACMDVPELRLIIGRREYVSELELLDFLGANGKQWDSAELRQWLQNGEAADCDDVIDTSWQASSLLQISPDFPIDEVRLSEISSTTDRGFKAYRRQFEVPSNDEQHDPKPMIILCSHAMLAQDMRRKIILAGQDPAYTEMLEMYRQSLSNLKGKKRANAELDFEAVAVIEAELGVALNTAVDGRTILPSFSSLMVDEAHLLDESISSSISDYVSLRGILSDLTAFRSAGGKLSADALGIVNRSISRLIEAAPKLEKRDFVALSADSNSVLTAHLTAIANVCNAIGSVRDENSAKFQLALRIRRAGKILDAAVNINRNHSFFRHSAVRNFPQLLVSNASVPTILSRLWSSLESAVLVSATLYIPTSNGSSATFMCNLLRVPLDRVQTHTPVHAKWSTSCVQGVWVTQSDQASQWLYPPTTRDAATSKKRGEPERLQAETKWHTDLSEELAKIWTTAAGGVLVLCTSYTTVKALCDSLTAKDAHFADSMVVASPGLSVRSQSQRFLTLKHDGRKPLWLAVGAAWTGVDIGGHDPWAELFEQAIPAETDNVLTDLVIPRLPYGANQSLSHLWRQRNNPNVPWDLFDASLRFKQALGRLVRRDKLPHSRRIFVLDARLGDSENLGRLVPFTQSLTKYKRKRYTL